MFISFSSNFASVDDLLRYWPKVSQGDDPGQPDTLYFICQRPSFDTWIIQIRFKTDNVASVDSVRDFYIPLVITTDKPGVVLDTSEATTYSGTSVADWGFKAVSVFTPGNSYPGDPKLFPMHLLIGVVDPFRALGKGDHLFAKLVFKVSEPTKICVDTTSELGIGEPLLVVTNNAVGYQPKWRGGCCVPSIPSLSQWGLIIFTLLLISYLTWFIYRKRKPGTSTFVGIFLFVFAIAFYFSYITP